MGWWRCFNNGVTRSEPLFRMIDPTDNYTQYKLEGRRRSQESQSIFVSQRTLASDRKCNSTWLEQISFTRSCNQNVQGRSAQVCLYSVFHNKKLRHFPGGPVVKTLGFYCAGCGFAPWLALLTVLSVTLAHQGAEVTSVWFTAVCPGHAEW